MNKQNVYKFYKMISQNVYKFYKMISQNEYFWVNIENIEVNINIMTKYYGRFFKLINKMLNIMWEINIR